MQQCQDFTRLTPELLLDAVEDALGVSLAGFANPLTSYINRVYELQCADGSRVIAKFYRPGRWSRDALLDEHAFVLECHDDEIPVVPPLRLQSGETLGVVDGIHFAVFEKRWGRQFELIDREGWTRLGRLLGRLHAVGARRPAAARVTLHPSHSTTTDIHDLLEGDFIPAAIESTFRDATQRVLDSIVPLFEGNEVIRLHGDCHSGNLLDRPGEGLMVIDFDDMAMGPPVQDMWMLLPDRLPDSRDAVNSMLSGYEDFREFDDRTLRLVEPLRLMRMLYFLAWCSRQVTDPSFLRNFPQWGTDGYWRQQLRDLQEQLAVIERPG